MGKTMTAKLSFACFLVGYLEELWKMTRKSVLMPVNAERDFNRGHCQFAVACGGVEIKL